MACFRISRPGRSREVCGNAHPRGMTVHDRTRLNGRLFLVLAPYFRVTPDLGELSPRFTIFRMPIAHADFQLNPLTD